MPQSAASTPTSSWRKRPRGYLRARRRTRHHVEPDERPPVGARGAVVPGLQPVDPAGSGQQRLRARHRGGRRLRRARAPRHPRRADRGHLHRPRLHRRRRQGHPVAADHRGRDRRPGARPGGQGEQRARRGHLRGSRRRNLRQPDRAESDLRVRSGTFEPGPRSEPRSTTSGTPAGGRSTSECSPLSEDGLLSPLWRAAGA